MKDPNTIQQRLSALPSVNTLLETPALRALYADYPRSHVIESVRHVLQDIRSRILDNPDDICSVEDLSDETITRRVVAHATAPPRRFRPVINASGILFHPAAGGAFLSAAARAAMAEASGPVIDDDEDRIEPLLCRITGAESAVTVSTSLTGLWLAIDTFGRHREVIISRGQLGTTDAGIRISDLLERCGARMIEVGATNKTHSGDYRAAIGPETGALCVIFPVAYALRGFTQEVPVAELAQLGAETGIPVICLMGRATLTPVTYGDWHPASVRTSVQAGTTVTIVGGAGLVGGPACGLALGRRDAIDRMRNNPLSRLFRADAVTRAGLEATLYAVDPEASGLDHHPAAWMMKHGRDDIRRRAERFLELCMVTLNSYGTFALVETTAYLTGSLLPAEAFPSYAVTLCPSGANAGNVVERLRQQSPAILTTLSHGCIAFDFRTIYGDQIEQTYAILSEVLKNACAN